MEIIHARRNKKLCLSFDLIVKQRNKVEKKSFYLII